MSKHNNLIIDAHNAESKRLLNLAGRMRAFIMPALTNPIDIDEGEYIIEQIDRAAVHASDYQIVQCEAGESAWISRIKSSGGRPYLVNLRRAKKGEIVFIVESSDHEVGVFRTYQDALTWAVEVIR